MTAESEIHLDPEAVRRLADNSPKLDAMLRRVSQKIVDTAKADFERQNHGDNELRTSETTPPKYVGSFYVEKIQDGVYHAGNSDPAWNLVEYGAHPGGGAAAVLRYRPLGHGFDVVAGTS